MTHDRMLLISTGNSRRDMAWKPTRISVSELYTRMSTPIRGTETMQDYLRMKKTQQDDLKDVGGYVGGSLSGGRRKADAVTGRDLVTLDFDNIPGWQTEMLIDNVDGLGCGYCVYSTRKHTASAPRLRVVIPLDRTVTPDEYEPVARRIAERIGIGMADPTTFEASRLMFWPSCCADGEYVFRTADRALVSADALLASYTDWRDTGSWPQVPGAANAYRKLAVRQGDPLTKPGIVGAYCRAHSVEDVLETILAGVYTPVDNDPDRYTYAGGSTTGGAILYDGGKFLFSHHATDPCSGRLVNAFDLVRLHRYADLDETADQDTPVSRLPSYRAMTELALTDKAVIAELNRAQQEAAAADFAQLQADKQADEDWAASLSRNQNGQIRETIDNALIILNGDPRLRGRFALNDFSGRGEILGTAPLPWESETKRRMWSDTDSNGLYWYLEKYWGIKGRGAIDSALDLHAAQHAFNEVQSYINRLQWDGIKRLDTLLIDYLGAEDTPYVRAVTRKSFAGAIARAMTPGCKFDTMLILTGPQGLGKSTILDKMSCGWFNDSIRTFEGKEASELLQGVWLVEIGELEAFRKSDVSRIKQFLSLRVDRYRAAYGRHVKEFPRCCVFFGSTNTDDFLQDSTGNRRFWPVDVGVRDARKSVWDDLDDTTIAQIWAEAKTRWQAAEPLYLTGNDEAEAYEKQEQHREASMWEGMIEDFVNRKVPEDWQSWSVDSRVNYWNGAATLREGVKLVQRDRICAMEVWVELMGGSMKDKNKADAREINGVLARLEGWKKANTSIRFGPYSTQRGYVRK